MNIEYLKLLASFATPVVVLFLGIWAKKITTNFEKRNSLNNRIIQKRSDIYEEIGADLNDIYVFLIRVGHWKSLSPSIVVSKKRIIDQKMHQNRPYWSASVFKKYEEYMSSCFESWTGSGEDAKIRTYPHNFHSLDKWDESWTSFFSTKEPNLNLVHEKYIALISAFSKDFGFIQE